MVNRLDKLTSGLVIIAKNQYIHNLMQKVYNTLSSNKKGESIKEDVVRIAEEYDMHCFGPINGCHYIKKLTKKQ